MLWRTWVLDLTVSDSQGYCTIQPASYLTVISPYTCTVKIGSDSKMSWGIGSRRLQ